MALVFWDVIQYQRLLFMMAILGIGGSLQVGFQGSMITYASVHIKEFINETWLERFGHSVHPSTLTLLWSLVISIFGLGGLLGSMSSGCLAAKYGKKNCFLASNLLMVVSAFLLGFSKMARSVELILVGRFLCGIGTGVCILLHPQYLGEVSPKKLRGFTSSTASMFWCLGKVLGQVMGLRELLGSRALWPGLLAFSGAAALVPLCTLPLFPESPPHLLLNRGDEEGCLKAWPALLPTPCVPPTFLAHGRNACAISGLPQSGAGVARQWARWSCCPAGSQRRYTHWARSRVLRPCPCHALLLIPGHEDLLGGRASPGRAGRFEERARGPEQRPEQELPGGGQGAFPALAALHAACHGSDHPAEWHPGS